MPKKKKRRKTNKTTHKVWKDKHQGIDSGYLRVLQFFFLGRRPGNTVKFQKVSPKLRKIISQHFSEHVSAEETLYL